MELTVRTAHKARAVKQARRASAVRAARRANAARLDLVGRRELPGPLALKALLAIRGLRVRLESKARRER